MINPVLVVYSNGSFLMSALCTSNSASSFAKDLLDSNNLDVQNSEVYLYDRREWKRLLSLCDENHIMITEKSKTFINKKIIVKEDVEVLVDWTGDDDTSDFYNQEEMQKILENRTYLESLRDFGLVELPHEIEKKYRIVQKDVIGYEETEEIKGELVILE